jgi:hypothetical protein
VRFLAIIAALISGGATMVDSPHAFLERLYRSYGPHGTGHVFAYPEARAFVDSSLLALLRRDQLASKGEVGALDFDPVCQCQEWGPFKVLSITAHMQGQNRALGEVRFENGPDGTKDAVAFNLALENGFWKIHDMSWRGTPSLQTYLRSYKY